MRTSTWILFAAFAATALESSPGFASTRECRVSATVQVYESSTLALKSLKQGESSGFPITLEPHEYPKPLTLRSTDGPIGEGSIWTGTLLGTSDGDVIQANCTFKLEGVEGAATLVMAITSPMAKSIVVLEKETADEIFLISVELKCVTGTPLT